METANSRTVIEGPQPAPDTLTRVAAAWVRTGLIPAPADWDAERRTVAAVAILAALHDTAGIRSRDYLAQLFDRLTTGEPPLIDALIADAREGSPSLVLTHWETLDGRSATSFVFRLTEQRDEPTLAPSDEWHAMLEGKLALAPLFEKIIESSVVPFAKKAGR